MAHSEHFRWMRAAYPPYKTSDILKMAVDTAKEEIRTHELASRRDLKELELQLAILIERSKNNTLLWMFAMLSGFAAAILGVMAKGFHWI